MLPKCLFESQSPRVWVPEKKFKVLNLNCFNGTAAFKNRVLPTLRRVLTHIRGMVLISKFAKRNIFHIIPFLNFSCIHRITFIEVPIRYVGETCGKEKSKETTKSWIELTSFSASRKVVYCLDYKISVSFPCLIILSLHGLAWVIQLLHDSSICSRYRIFTHK